MEVGDMLVEDKFEAEKSPYCDIVDSRTVRLVEGEVHQGQSDAAVTSTA